ncbi:MAG: peptidyl-prolyl cis-trans isomerase, partial [Porphyrobacter sp.]|nr:peptidyl-prolyl cis-trans isomerase [Porphyrobacter sp.]
SALEQVRQEFPTLTMEAFVAQGGLDEVLDQMVQRAALAEFARDHGLRAGDRLVDSELVQLPAFRGPDGQFDAAAFRAAIAQRGLTEEAVRQDLAMGLLARQLLTPVSLSPVMPASIGRRYASLLRERREGAIALLPAAAYAPDAGPTPAQLRDYYNRTRDRYIRPERRVIRYAIIEPSALGDLPPPTEAQIEQAFRRDRAKYAAREERRFTQLVVPTQAAAQSIIEEVRGGATLAEAAQSKGLRTTAIGPVTRAQLTSLASAAVADAGFAAAPGTLTAPARGGLGWYVLQVEDVSRIPARTLAQVRPQIAAALAQEQRQAAFAELLGRVDERLQDGESLSDIARELDLSLTTTRPATADGAIYGVAGESVPAELTPLLSTAFEMPEGEPQLAELARGERYAIFDVAQVTPSAVAPLSEIREQVAALWRRDQGARAARAAADRVIRRIASGSTLAAALQAEEPALPSPDRLSLSREDLSRAGQVPPPIALFFSMAEGTVKKLDDRGDNGWFVVALEDIVAPEVPADDPIVGATLAQLGTVTGEEYAQQFVAAVSGAVGIERNPAAIEAVAAQLTGRGN